VTVGQLRRRFVKYNRLYWEGRLALPKLIIVPAGQKGPILNSCGNWGAFMVEKGVPVIEIRAMAYEIDGTFLNGVLLHEMIHEEIGADKAHGSREWNAAVRRLSLRGALKEVL
jgi:hypothetical protein